jgi:surfactin synthase thioesterase subunit
MPGLTLSSLPQNLYNNLTYMYPNSNIWVTGHSLGGALAALLGVTFGAPVVAFESPGERMAAERLHLPSPVSPGRTVMYRNSLLNDAASLAVDATYNAYLSHSRPYPDGNV